MQLAIVKGDNVQIANLLREGVILFPHDLDIKILHSVTQAFYFKSTMKTSLTHLPKKKKGVHLLITDIEPICVERVSQQIMIIIIIAWSVCFMQQKQ